MNFQSSGIRPEGSIVILQFLLIPKYRLGTNPTLRNAIDLRLIIIFSRNIEGNILFSWNHYIVIVRKKK